MARAMQPQGTPGKDAASRRVLPEPSYFLLKASAEHLPLLESVAGLVLMTPPYLGAGRVPQRECCTRDLAAYAKFLGHTLDEAARIAKPGGYILFHTNLLPVRRTGGIPRVRFQVFRRLTRGTGCRIRQVGEWETAVRLARIRGTKWLGLPVHTYERLIRKYSRAGEMVVHVFSGTGNSALAAVASGCFPVLIDLHHHRFVRQRLNRRLRHRAAQIRQFS